MAERYPGGVISKTPPTVTPPNSSGPLAGEGGSASGMWTLDTVLEYEKAGAWPKPVLPRELYAWGLNSNWQLGLNDQVSRSSPVQVGALINWSQVSGGNTFSAAIKTDGTLWTWGFNGAGQLGDNTVGFSKSSPIQIGALTNWYQVSAATSGDHAISIKTDGTLWAWGDNIQGAIGNNTVTSRSSPVQVGALTDWAQISAGYRTSFSVKTNGTIWGWGRNNFGELGINDTLSRSSPVQIGSLTNWSQVSAGGLFTISIKTDGTLWAWGSNGAGQLGDNSTVLKSSPVQVGSLTNWSKISAGDISSSSIKTDGTLWSWGRNNLSGPLGDGTVVNKSSPVQIGAQTNWSQISVGSDFAMSIKTDGTLWVWGRNNEGQLGNNTVISVSSPVQVGALTDWFKISAGDSHSLAITKG